MSASPYVSRCRVEKVAGLHRRAHLSTGEKLEFGVHGPIMEHYQLKPDRERPLPVDYIVAATGG